MSTLIKIDVTNQKPKFCVPESADNGTEALIFIFHNLSWASLLIRATIQSSFCDLQNQVCPTLLTHWRNYLRKVFHSESLCSLIIRQLSPPYTSTALVTLAHLTALVTLAHLTSVLEHLYGLECTYNYGSTPCYLVTWSTVTSFA